MSIGGRALVRLASFFSAGILLALTVVSLLSEIRWLNALGAVLVLFLLSRIVAVGRAERLISRASLKSSNVKNYLSSQTYRLIETAYDRALLGGGNFSLNILQLLIRRAEIRKVLVRIDVDPKEFENKLKEYWSKSKGEGQSRDELLGKAEALALGAFYQAVRHFGKTVEPHDLLGAVGALKNEDVDRLFALFEIRDGDFETAFIFAREAERSVGGFGLRSAGARSRVMNRAWTARPTPILDRYSEDITAAARAGKGALLMGHEREYERLVNVLSRPGSPNALLIGEPGSGKEVLVHHLAFQIIKDRVPKPLFDKRLVSLSVSSLASGADAAEVEERVMKVLNEIRRAGNVILYIPDIHDLLKTFGIGHLSGADVLIPALKDADFSVIGATYPRDYKLNIETNNDFRTTFEPLMIEEISENEAVRYMIFRSLVFEKTSRVVVSFGAVKRAVELAHKYFHQKLLPGSAEDLLAEAVAVASARKDHTVSVEDIIVVAEKKTNVKIQKVGSDEAKTLLNLENEIHEHYVDQDQAVSAVAGALRQYRSGLARKGGPIATFLFVGPTGVGKTELAKILASKQFGSKEALVRFDMTEYQDKQSFFRLIGNPDGSSSGSLTDAIREKPYSLVLLDEFEKAFPDILNLFLQVFDDGRLTDSVGRTVNFENTIIIATSNAHSDLVKTEIEKGTDMRTLSDMLKSRLTEYFRPEMINRFTDIIVFKSLSREDTKLIAELNLADLSRDLSKTQAIDLTFDESAVSKIAELGYDPVFGARPLRKVISDKIKGTLAEKLLRQEIPRGSSVLVSWSADEFVFDIQ